MKKPGVRATLAATAAAAVASAGTAAAVVVRSAAAPAATGITVHGRWDVKVLDPAGRLVRERRFENALLPSGQQILNDLLSRRKTAGTWAIFLASSVSGQGMFVFDTAEGLSGTTPAPGFSYNLTLAFPPSHGGGTPGLHLEGTVVSPIAQSITAVYSSIGSCSPTTAPAACVDLADKGTGQNFTSRALSPAIPVQPGQTVSLDVAFSFS